MVYRFGSKLKQDGKNIKKYMAGAAAAIMMAGAFAFPALAANNGGGYCVNSSNGCEQSMSNTQCAGHGAFGAFGEQGNAPHDFRGGANGDATAYNNSTLCGNSQGAAGQLNP